MRTSHGKVLTPSFVPVATKGTLKSLPPKDIKEIGVQIAFVNTFHLTIYPGVDVLKKFGGVHKYAKLDIPLMSDSAGFQVFSLGQEKPGKKIKTREGDEALLLGISEDGVKFRSPRDGKEILFSPEFSIKNQEKIGADIMMAFDECIYGTASHEYTKSATERTHRWLLRCIKEKSKKKQSATRLDAKSSARQVNNKQFLYGIVQGGRFKDLREESAKFVSAQNVDGVAIGGVSVGETKKEMREQVKWTMPYLPQEKPRHLLGVGRAEDILDLIKEGIDTFDCVEPTRLARNGTVFQKRGKSFVRLDIGKSAFLNNKNPIQKDCRCYTCQNFSLSFVHHLFKERELLGCYLATYHNLHFFSQFFISLRKDIERGVL